MKDKKTLLCVCTRKTFQFLKLSLPDQIGSPLWWAKDIPGSLNSECRFILIENEPGSRSVSALKELVHLNPGVEVISFSLKGSFRQAVKLLKIGVSNYFSLPEEIEELGKYLFSSLQKEKNKVESKKFIDRQKSRYDFQHIIGVSPSLLKVLNVAERIIKTRTSPVLIRGETGTGKELLARAIHYNSAQPGEPFVEVNCSAIPGNLLESELFGYEKGAFTDAKVTKKGLFEIAHRGTIFLDEIGQMDPNLQVKLLNVIEYKTIRRLGSTESIPIEIRIIAATNLDLEEAIRENRFRRDMYYRLNVISLTLPPLRDRGEDILSLARFFLDRFTGTYGLGKKKFSAGAKKALMAHDWPGNIRELMNTIERSVVLYDGGVIDADMLQLSEKASEITENSGTLSQLAIDIPDDGVTRDEVEKILVGKILMLTRGNKSKAARMLGVTRPTLLNMIKRHGLS
jgi:DNA-binding NtrC family response regulator